MKTTKKETFANVFVAVVSISALSSAGAILVHSRNNSGSVLGDKTIVVQSNNPSVSATAVMSAVEVSNTATFNEMNKVGISTSITNKTTEPINLVAGTDIFLTSNDSNLTLHPTSDTDENIQSTSLAPGSTITGIVYFEVPNTLTSYQLNYQPSTSTDTVTAPVVSGN